MKTFSLTIVGLLVSICAVAQSAWPDSIYTARHASYLTEEEQLVVAELNKVRTNPQRYAEEVVKPFIERFESPRSNIYINSEGMRISTCEGIAAVKECIAALKKATPLPMLYPIEGMTLAAKQHASDQRGGRTGHNSSDGCNMSQRLNRFGKWDILCGENISYGKNSAADIVLQLMIDDCVASRGHRKNIMNPLFRLVGIGIDTHKKYRYSCTIDFAGGYTNK